jgi:hypothetical protein
MKGTAQPGLGDIIIIIVIIIIIIYFNCKWVFTRWQWLCNKTQQTNNTRHPK